MASSISVVTLRGSRSLNVDSSISTWCRGAVVLRPTLSVPRAALFACRALGVACAAARSEAWTARVPREVLSKRGKTEGGEQAGAPQQECGKGATQVTPAGGLRVTQERGPMAAPCGARASRRGRGVEEMLARGVRGLAPCYGVGLPTRSLHWPGTLPLLSLGLVKRLLEEVKWTSEALSVRRRDRETGALLTVQL